MRDEATRDDPFARLAHTHRRIEERLDDLVAATETLLARPNDLDAFEAVERVLGFFDRAGRRHHDDEERSLFPRLPDEPDVVALVRVLREEHLAHDGALRALDANVRAIGNGAPSTEQARGLADGARHLRTLYLAHIDREERELFPRVKSALSAHDLAEMAREFDDRRPRPHHG
ncbi:MAG: hemerythrin domain-containing protein [Polyangiaceae bacterium]